MRVVRRLILATKGPASAGAARMARCLAALDGASMEILSVVPGDLGSALARVSAEHDVSSMFVADPAWGLEVVRFVGQPVLIVPSHVTDLPLRAVLAIDFSSSSIRAATTALDTLERPGRACMINVAKPSPHVELLFDALEDTIGRAQGIEITKRCVLGDVATSILRIAALERVDLISVGRSKRAPPGYGQPASLGSVTRTILSSAPCSVLVA